MSYANLPTLTNILRDNRLQVKPPAPVTESTFIIGTAVDGPSEPMRITSAQDAEQLFGTFVKANGKRNGATLIPSIYEAAQAGSSNIGVLRIGGAYATLDLDDGSAVKQLTARGRFKGSKYNAVQIETTANELKIYGIKKSGDTWVEDDNAAATTPVPKKSYTLADYSNYQELIEAVNDEQHIHNVVLELADDISPTDAVSLAVMAKTPLATGADGLNPNSGTLESLLDEAFELLADIDMDYVVVPDAQITYDLDAKTMDFTLAIKLGDFCHDVSENNRMTFGAIAVKPLDNASLANVKKLYDTLVANPVSLHGTSFDQEGNPVDVGRYVNVTVGEAAFNAPKLGSYFGPFSIAYLGFASKLPPESATTNKPIPNVIGLRYKFSAKQADALAGAGYVCLRERFGRGIVVADGVTGANINSVYSRFSTGRIVKAAINVATEVLEPFLGEAGDIVAFNSMNTELESGFKAMVDAGALQAYDFKIVSHPDELIQGKVRLYLDLVPAFEVRNVTNVVSIRKSL